MGWKFNPFTGTLDQVGTSAGGGNQPKTEDRILTGPEATAKQITLAATPLTPSEVMMDIPEGSTQVNGFDFSVSGNILTWNGLGLDVSLSAGDKIRLRYNV